MSLVERSLRKSLKNESNTKYRTAASQAVQVLADR